MIISTLAAMTAGYVLNMLFGTPKAISAQKYVATFCKWLAPEISAKYQDSAEGQHTAGTVYLTLLILAAVVPALIVLILLYAIFPAGAIVVDTILCWSVLDIRSTSINALAAARKIRSKKYSEAEKYAARLSGENCSQLDESGMVRACVQGVADRTVDRAAAPLLYMFILSGVGGLFFKMIDSAANLSYGDDEQALSFAEPVRKLQNALCFLPGKLASIIMLVDALFLKQNTRAAEKALNKDKYKCRRICFGGCRAVLAGLLGISLLPEEVYSEQFMRTYTIGEHLKNPEQQDITVSNQIMLGTAFIIMALFFAIKLTIGVWF